MGNTICTLKDIADALGISIGTVDRAMHNRGRINPATRKKILEKADELGYKTNTIARILKMNKDINIFLVVPKEPAYFFGDIIAGAKYAEKELEELRIKLRIVHVELADLVSEIEVVNNLITERPDGIVIFPINNIALRDSINIAYNNGIDIVTVNSDVPNSKRLVFIGQDEKSSGRLAAELMGNFLGGCGKLAVFAGNPEVLGQSLRVNGFLEEIKQNFQDIEIVCIENNVNELTANILTKELLNKVHNIKGIFSTNCNGLIGVAKALEHSRLLQSIKLIGFDMTEDIRKYIMKGFIQATIWQDPFSQGYNAVKVLSRKVAGYEQTFQDNIYTKRHIFLRSNLDDYYAK